MFSAPLGSTTHQKPIHLRALLHLLSMSPVPRSIRHPALARRRTAMTSCFNALLLWRCSCRDFPWKKPKFEFVLSLLSVWALQWAETNGQQTWLVTQSLSSLVTHFLKVFQTTFFGFFHKWLSLSFMSVSHHSSFQWMEWTISPHYQSPRTWTHIAAASLNIQRFIGFSKFYRCFTQELQFHNCTPHISLENQARSLSWNSDTNS